MSDFGVMLVLKTVIPKFRDSLIFIIAQAQYAGQARLKLKHYSSTLA
jgi:hypothetical protein